MAARAALRLAVWSSPPWRARPTARRRRPLSRRRRAATTTTGHGSCPRDALKLGVCANVLGLVKAKVGSPPYQPCCSLLDGLLDLEAAVCLCTAITANILGINLNLPIDLSLILNNWGYSCPNDFHCA